MFCLKFEQKPYVRLSELPKICGYKISERIKIIQPPHTFKICSVIKGSKHLIFHNLTHSSPKTSSGFSSVKLVNFYFADDY
jgi:hypothetical protein